MALQYLRIFSDRKGHIVAIAERWLDERGILKVHTAWNHEKGERGIVEDFLAGSQFWSNKWVFVPAGLHLQGQVATLWKRSSHYGFIPFGADPLKVKPSLDLSGTLVLLNSDNRRPDGSYGDAPDAFYGASLEKFTFRQIDGETVGALVANRDYAGAKAVIQREADAFWDLYVLLKDAMVALREAVVFPAFRPPVGPAPLDEQVL